MTKPLLRDLLEGEDPSDVPHMAWPTPGQWLYRFNRLSPEKRLEVIELCLNDTENAMQCLIEDHAGVKDTLELRESQIRVLQRELSSKKRQLRQKNRRV